MTRASTLSAVPDTKSAPTPARNIGGRKIAAVQLHEFRSYRSLVIEREMLDGSRAIVLTGENGAGKTNLLEAISMLSPGRGLRRAALPQLVRQHGDTSDETTEANGWSVQAAIQDDIGETVVATAFDSARGGRSLRIDGAPAENLAQLAHIAPMLWLTPAIERSVTESASARRRFLDRIVMSLEPDHGARATRYERAMRERNRLLQESGNATWLDGLEEVMAREGSLMQAARRRVVAMLSEHLEEQSLPAFPEARMALAPDPDAPDEPHDIEEDMREESRLRTQLREVRLLDRRAGRALAGAHRCDLRIRHQTSSGEMPLESCSSGEQKALLLGLVLAHGRLLSDLPAGAPILLLDEVTAHLDAARRRALFDILAQSGAHSWMTGTDPSLFNGCQEDACFLSVSTEGVSPAKRTARSSLN